MEKDSKCAFKQKRKSRLAQRIKEKAHLPITYGHQSHMNAAQAQHATAIRKAVVGRLHLGAAAPPLHAPIASPSTFAPLGGVTPLGVKHALASKA
jgi:glutamate formiminotransferase